ncbi:MAG TPA: hypothetical protein VHJ83_08605 [Micromonosporaceae bacterium]|nr:hypothetical protein [Micromonosporaceae bacterium]
MFEEISGLPLHPLAVHAPLVLVPLLIAVAVGYAVVPPLRRWLGWTAVVLGLLAPVSVWVARASGNAFRDRLAVRDQLPPERASKVAEHAGLSLTLLWLVAGLGLVAIGMVVLAAGLRAGSRRAADAADPDGTVAVSAGQGGTAVRRTGATVVWILFAVAVLALSAGVGWYLIQTGDSGAQMVWEGS